MSKPTQKQIEATIKALKEIKPKVKHFSFFGDDHHAAIEAQIEVLSRGISLDTIDERNESGFWSDHEHDNAMEARYWLDGEYEGPGLVEEWKELTT